MSRKKSPPVVAEFDEAPRKPWTLGFIVLAAGSFSTWYWYKPLPPEAGQAAYANWDHTPLPDVWDDAELVKPSLQTDLGSPEQGISDAFNEASQGIVGTGKNGLLPVPSYKKNLGELVATEPIPSLPSIAPIGEERGKELSQGPNPWVSDPVEPSGTGWLTSAPRASNDLSRGKPSVDSVERNSIGRVGASDWPDLTYTPASNSAVDRGRAPGIPSLLSSSHPTEPLSIRTKEDSERGAHVFAPNSVQGSVSVEAIREEANRKPLFIRQPKRGE